MSAAGLLSVEKTGDALKTEARKFDSGPALYVSNLCIKIGAIFLIGAAVTYLGAQATARQEQGYLNDIQDRLGEPRTQPPTPPKVPPPPPAIPFYQAGVQNILGAYNELSPVDASANLALFTAMYTASNGIYTQAQTVGAPSNVLTDLEALNLDLASCTEAMKGAVLATTGSPTQPPSPAGASSFWSAAKTLLSGLPGLINQVAVDFGMPAPIPVPQPNLPAPASIPWWEVPLADAAWVGMAIVGTATTIADIPSTVVNDVTGAASWVAGGLSAVANDVGGAVAFIGKALGNLPQLAVDGLGYGITWGLNTICTDLWPGLLVLGAVLVGVGSAIRFTATTLWPRIKPRLELGAKARVDRWLGRFDAWYGTQAKVDTVWKEKGTEAAIQAAAADPVYVRSTTPLPSPAVPLAGQRARAGKVKEITIPPEPAKPETPINEPAPPPGGQPAPPPPGALLPPPPTDGSAKPTNETPPATPVAPPSPKNAPEGPPVKPPEAENAPETPVPTPTTETEEVLGERPNRAPTPEELARIAAEAEANRRATHPDPPPVPTYRQRKEELEREEADDLLKLAGSFDDELSQVKTPDDAYKLADNQTRIIKEAQGNRRAAKAAAKVVDRKPFSRKVYRGAMEGVNAGLRPEEYGA